MTDPRSIPYLMDYLRENGLRGVLDRSVTPVGNVGAGVDNLMTKDIPANTLERNSDIVTIKANGRFAANGNNKQVKALIGGTEVLASGVIAANDKRWSAEIKFWRTAAGVNKAYAEFRSDSTIIQTYTALTKDETTALAVLFTGEATATDDIIQDLLLIEYAGVAV